MSKRYAFIGPVSYFLHSKLSRRLLAALTRLRYSSRALATKSHTYPSLLIFLPIFGVDVYPDGLDEKSTYQAVLDIIKREGVLGLYSGLNSSLLGIAVTNG